MASGSENNSFRLYNGRTDMLYTQTNGISMYYEEHGTGAPLVLIMGITARGNVWEKHV